MHASHEVTQLDPADAGERNVLDERGAEKIDLIGFASTRIRTVFYLSYLSLSIYLIHLSIHSSLLYSIYLLYLGNYLYLIYSTYLSTSVSILSNLNNQPSYVTLPCLTLQSYLTRPILSPPPQFPSPSQSPSPSLPPSPSLL